MRFFYLQCDGMQDFIQAGEIISKIKNIQCNECSKEINSKFKNIKQHPNVYFTEYFEIMCRLSR